MSKQVLQLAQATLQVCATVPSDFLQGFCNCSPGAGRGRLEQLHSQHTESLQNAHLGSQGFHRQRSKVGCGPKDEPIVLAAAELAAAEELAEDDLKRVAVWVTFVGAECPHRVCDL